MSKIDNKSLILGVWPSAWGPMGGVRSEKGLFGITMPGYGLKDLREKLAWDYSGATFDDDSFEQIAVLCRDYINRKPVDFSGVECDLSALGPFGRKILTACRKIEYGRTLTYTQLALKAGEDGKQRAAAQALGANPVPMVIPCHRVVAAGGKSGGYSATGGVEQKLRMLAMEKEVATQQG